MRWRLRGRRRRRGACTRTTPHLGGLERLIEVGDAAALRLERGLEVLDLERAVCLRFRCSNLLGGAFRLRVHIALCVLRPTRATKQHRSTTHVTHLLHRLCLLLGGLILGRLACSRRARGSHFSRARASTSVALARASTLCSAPEIS